MSGVVFVETVRRHVTNGIFGAALLIVSVIAVFAGVLGAPPGLWSAFTGIAAIILGCQLIGPEFSKGTLQLVLAKPVNRSAYLLSRYCGVVVSIWIFYAVPFLVNLAARLTINDQKFQTNDLAVALNTMLVFTMTCGLLVFFGTFSRSYMNVAFYLLIETFLVVTASMLPPSLRDNPQIARALTTITQNLFPDPAQTFDPKWMSMVISNAAVALLLACLIFKRREVPYGAD
jgi:ABC-type transport system involved in multi-copper enzyme maturation permease subunit